MRRFRRVTGEQGFILELEVSKTYDLHIWELYNFDHSDDAIGRIRFRITARDRSAYIETIQTSGHSNDIDARNPYPGVGRLLMFLVCEKAKRSDVTTINLESVGSSAPFYRRMGMRHVEPRTNVPALLDPEYRSHPRAGLQDFTVRRPLNQHWVNEFNRHYDRTRNSGGYMTAQVDTVLLNITAPMNAQWQEIYP